MRKMKTKCEIGYSMIEVLVSIFLLSVGVLGAMSMQLAATRTTQQSAYQTMALQLAGDVADTVRAYAGDQEHAQAVGGRFELDYMSIQGAAVVFGAACYFNQCGVSEFVDAEIGEWKMRMATSFPAARLRICRDASPWDDAAQAYKWDCGGKGSEVPLVIKLGWQARNPDGSLVRSGDGSFPPSVVLPVAAI